MATDCSSILIFLFTEICLISIYNESDAIDADMCLVIAIPFSIILYNLCMLKYAIPVKKVFLNF